MHVMIILLLQSSRGGRAGLEYSMHVHAMYMHTLCPIELNSLTRVSMHFGALVFGAAMSFDEGYLNETPWPRDFQRALEDVIRLARTLC